MFYYGNNIYFSQRWFGLSYFVLAYIKRYSQKSTFRVLGHDSQDQLARHLFDQLKGSGEEIEDRILQMDLMETKNNLPVNIKVIGCTLEEMAENCKVITKEAFKIFTFES